MRNLTQMVAGVLAAPLALVIAHVNNGCLAFHSVRILADVSPLSAGVKYGPRCCVLWQSPAAPELSAVLVVISPSNVARQKFMVLQLAGFWSQADKLHLCKTIRLFLCEFFLNKSRQNFDSF